MALALTSHRLLLARSGGGVRPPFGYRLLTETISGVVYYLTETIGGVTFYLMEAM